MTAADEIFETYRGPLLSLCLHLTGNRQDAEDAAQETFVAVFNGLSKFRGDAQLSTWIYRIAIRTAIRIKARHRSHEELEEVPDAAVGVEEQIIDRERMRILERALARLPLEQRSVLALFSIEGLSHKEIAATLGIPEGTVWSRLSNARKRLAAEMTRMGVTPH